MSNTNRITITSEPLLTSWNSQFRIYLFQVYVLLLCTSYKSTEANILNSCNSVSRIETFKIDNPDLSELHLRKNIKVI